MKKARKIGFGSRPAVMVIDMQNDFIQERAPFELGPKGREVIPHVKRLIENARQHNIPVIYTKHIITEDPAYDGFMPIKLQGAKIRGLRMGTNGIKVVKDITPKGGDYIISKKRCSAFFNTDLDLLLRGLKVDTIILTGVTTGGCVRCTALDAFSRNYRIIVPEECTADKPEEMFDYSIFSIQQMWGDIVELNDVIQYFDNLERV